MDPISQGVVGSLAATSFAKPAQTRIAALAGWLGGMLADADILIRSQSDPLLNIEYHRHFSHSLIFIPVGGLIVLLALWPFFAKKLPTKDLFLYSTLGYATAGLLDACTSYGTQLLWPFSNYRVSWNIISIIDPVFTLPLIVLIAIAIKKRKPNFARFAALFALAYLSLGIVQNHRASLAQTELQLQRGHANASKSTVKPSIANLVLWRSIYLYQDQYYVDAIRVGLLKGSQVYPGSKVQSFDLEKKLASLDPHDPAHHDLRRFNHFSEGYLSALPEEPNFITDLRYSAIPNSIDPLWGIDLQDKTEAGHLNFVTRRDIGEAAREDFKRMLLGN